jgi:hypothetical protein
MMATSPSEAAIGTGYTSLRSILAPRIMMIDARP